MYKSGIYISFAMVIKMAGHGHSDPTIKCDTSQSQDESTHQIWNSYLKEYKRYAPDTINLKTRSEVKFKVTVTRKWFVALCYTKMHLHTKFEIPIKKNIGDMNKTQCSF